MAALWNVRIYFPEELLCMIDINLDVLTVIVEKKQGANNCNEKI